jgi:hypothetical protein
VRPETLIRWHRVTVEDRNSGLSTDREQVLFPASARSAER